MLSTQYRLRLEFICKKIANKEDVKLEDMIWAEKLAKAHTTARDWLNKARRQAAQDIQEGTMDDFMNKMGLGDPDPSNYRTGSLVRTRSLTGSNKTNLMIGDNVTNDFLDNLANHQYRKMHKSEFEKITPETYEKMNEEFEEEGLAFRINVPTQQQIDDWRQHD